MNNCTQGSSSVPQLPQNLEEACAELLRTDELRTLREGILERMREVQVIQSVSRSTLLEILEMNLQVVKLLVALSERKDASESKTTMSVPEALRAELYAAKEHVKRLQALISEFDGIIASI